MTTIGLKPAMLPSSWSVIQWLLSRPVAVSRYVTAQPTPRIPPIAVKSLRHVSMSPNDSPRARPSADDDEMPPPLALVRLPKYHSWRTIPLYSKPSLRVISEYEGFDARPCPAACMETSCSFRRFVFLT